MAKRISQLPQLTAVQVAALDIVPIVDISAGTTKYITVQDLTGLPDVGWIATGEAWSFSSYNSTLHTGVITVPSDATVKYSKGMWVRFTQPTHGTKYGRIVAVTATSITVDMSDANTLVNEAITSPVYSPLESPYGAPSEDGMTHSVANAGNAGGTMYFINNRGIKHLSLMGGSAPISGAGLQTTQRNVNLPTGLFASYTSAQVSVTALGATEYQSAVFNSISATTAVVNVWQALGTNGTNTFSLRITGT